jgi:hypothetical protein
MPISYKYQTIFVHIPKTAGTSIYNVLEIPYEYNIRALMTMEMNNPCLNHLPPIQIQKFVTPEVWNTFYKFTIVRNPYDRIVSDYRFLQPLIGQQYDLSTFDKFVSLVERVVTTNAYTENLYFDHFRPQSHYFKNIKYDYIGRFENLNSDIQNILQAIGSKGSLPWNNKSRSSDDHYHKYFNTEIKSIVDRLYTSDLEMFGYKY